MPVIPVGTRYHEQCLETVRRGRSSIRSCLLWTQKIRAGNLRQRVLNLVVEILERKFMEFRETALAGMYVIDPRVFEDERGFFMETYHRAKFIEAGIAAEFVQDNHSRSSRRTLRGLHYQIEHAQGKLVRAVRGEIYDVGVDIRRNSPTFGHWFGTTLSAENRRQLYVPPGFAHGFCVVSDIAEVTYKCTDLYHPEHERSLLWNDPALGIDWPIMEPTLSAKDAAGSLLSEAECYESMT